MIARGPSTFTDVHMDDMRPRVICVSCGSKTWLARFASRRAIWCMLTVRRPAFMCAVR